MANEVNSLITRGQLAAHVSEFIQDLSTNRLTMIKRDLDYGYREALQRFEWPQLLRWADADISVLNNVPYFTVEKDIRTIIGVLDAQTPFRLQEVSAATLLDHTSGFSQIQGVPTQYAFVGDRGISTILTSTTAMEVVSDGTDTRAGWIKGLLSGQARTLSFTLTSTSAVSLGNWDEVYEFFLTTTSTSRTVILRVASAGATQATIAPNELKAVYRLFRLFTLPSGNRTYRILYKYTPPQIFDDTHTYIIPVQDYLIEWGIAKSYESRRQGTLASRHLSQAEIALTRVWYEVRGNAIDLAVPAAALSRVTQGAGIVINAYGYR